MKIIKQATSKVMEICAQYTWLLKTTTTKGVGTLVSHGAYGMEHTVNGLREVIFSLLWHQAEKKMALFYSLWNGMGHFFCVFCVAGHSSLISMSHNDYSLGTGNWAL